jgi:hypothetical protein
MQQRPQIAVALQNNMSATTAIAAVRTAFGYVLGAMKMHTARSAFA